MRISPAVPLSKCCLKKNQVFINMATNARDAFEQIDDGRQKTLTISARECEFEGKQGMRIVIKDNGPGISEQILPNLFDPFFTTKGKSKGTGLGLSVSHGIIKDHGGMLTVKSMPGIFTRFQIDLPLDGPAKE